MELARPGGGGGGGCRGAELGTFLFASPSSSAIMLGPKFRAMTCGWLDDLPAPVVGTDVRRDLPLWAAVLASSSSHAMVDDGLTGSAVRRRLSFGNLDHARHL